MGTTWRRRLLTVPVLLVFMLWLLPSTTAIAATPTNITVANVTAQYSDYTTLSATMVSDDGTPLAGQVVQFDVDGFPAGSAVTAADGVAYLTYNVQLGQGTYTVMATFAGSADYYASTGMGTLTVTSEGATLHYVGQTVADGGPVYMAAQVTEAADGTLGDITRAGTVYFTLQRLYDGAMVGTYVAPVGADGRASITTAPLPPGGYAVTVELAQNSYYNGVPSTDMIRGATHLALANVSGTYSDPVSLRATLTGGGFGLAGKMVTFHVDGMVVGVVTTDVTGTAVLTYTNNLPAGTHTILATFDGDYEWDWTVASATLTSTPESGVLSYTGPTGARKPGSVQLTADLVQQQDGSPGDLTRGSVQFLVTNNTTGVSYGPYPIGLDAGGRVTTLVDLLESGNYTVQTSLAANGYFTAAGSASTLVVDGAPPVTPGAPTVTAPSCHLARLAWNPGTDSLTGVSAYKVWRSVNGGPAEVVATVTGTTWDDTALVPGESYAYALSAVDALGNESVAGSTTAPLSPAVCASLGTVTHDGSFNVVTTSFQVAVPQVYVNIRYRVVGADSGQVVREFWAFGTGQADATLYGAAGTYTQATNWNGSNDPDRGRYNFVTEIWYGSSPAAMYAHPATVTQSIRIK